MSRGNRKAVVAGFREVASTLPDGRFRIWEPSLSGFDSSAFSFRSGAGSARPASLSGPAGDVGQH